jgi:hypothetical protein
MINNKGDSVNETKTNPRVETVTLLTAKLAEKGYKFERQSGLNVTPFENMLEVWNGALFNATKHSDEISCPVMVTVVVHGDGKVQVRDGYRRGPRMKDIDNVLKRVEKSFEASVNAEQLRRSLLELSKKNSGVFNQLFPDMVFESNCDNTGFTVKNKEGKFVVTLKGIRDSFQINTWEFLSTSKVARIITILAEK